jgi:hypothetical protein
MWWAGSAAPARFLVAVLPVAALPIAMVAAEAATVLLLIVSIMLAAPRGLFEGGRFIFNNRGGVDATIEWITRSVDLSLALPSVHRDGGLIAVRDGAMWIVVFAAAVLLARIATRARSRRAGYTAVALATTAAMIVASNVMWSLRNQPVITPDRSKLAALSAYRPEWHAVVIDTARWRRAEFLPSMTVNIGLTPPIRVDRVPAGEYEVLPATGARIFVGRRDPAVDQFTPAHNRLRLPVALQALYVSQAPLILRPIAVATPPTRRCAIRATRFGRARVFVFDEQTYLERDGFWTRANGSALVVIDVDDPESVANLPIAVSAGAVPTSVTLSIGDWEQSLSLAAGQRREVLLPRAENGSWPLRIRSGAGFRPSERDPGSADVRMLAAWVSVLSSELSQ